MNSFGGDLEEKNSNKYHYKEILFQLISQKTETFNMTIYKRIFVFMNICFILCLMPISLFAKNYQGQPNSLIQWNEIETDKWLSFENWKKILKIKESFKDWEENLSYSLLNEKIGKVLACSGDCQSFRGLGGTSVQFRSTLKEGDEIITKEDSYLWLFLLDGSLVRLSPDSSLTLKELNIGTEQNFISARVNYGNIFFLSRSTSNFQELKLRQTDTLFNPLPFFKANDLKKNIDFDVKDEFIGPQYSSSSLRQYTRANQLIKENNKITQKKKTYYLITARNATVFGHSFNLEVIALKSAKTFFKLRKDKTMKQKEERDNYQATFLYRGFENTSETDLEKGLWYEVDKRGRNLSPFENFRKFSMGEYITTRIPTILVARELLLKESPVAFKKWKSKELSQEGYRLWGNLNDENSDLSRRLQFLKVYTRRIETTNILSLDKLNDKLKEKGESIHLGDYSPRFYEKAIKDYYTKGNRYKGLNSQEDSGQNSTSRRLWKILNVEK